MGTIRLNLLVVLVGLMLAVPALATDLGDAAPPLKIAKWIKGGPVNLAEGKGKNVYVVEFWATWCPPCLTSIPHLTKMQSKFKDQGVVVVGLTGKDRKQDLSKVNAFVKEMGSKMDYVVAYDDGEKTNQAYMDAFGAEGIPHSFVIDKKGRIVWQGHPMNGLDTVVEQVVAGKFDLEKAKKEYAEQQELRKNRKKVMGLAQRYFAAVIESKSGAGADKLVEELMPLIRKDAGTLNGLSWEILTNEEIVYRDLKLALRMAELANRLSEGKNASILDTYARALWDTGKKAQAVDYQQKAVDTAEDDATKAALKEILDQYKKKLDK